MIIVTHTGYAVTQDDRTVMIGRIDGAKSQRQAHYATGEMKPNYPMPATMDQRRSFITNLWLNAKHGRQERKVRRWWLALCFDANNYYLG